jgi:exodeoxyribonuclease VII small subunit
LNEVTFKQMMERLEALTARLEKEDLELEEGLRLFEEGVGLIREARQRLGSAGARVEKLMGSLDEELKVEEVQLQELEE